MIGRIQSAIAEALPGAEIEVEAGGPGHFTITILSPGRPKPISSYGSWLPV